MRSSCSALRDAGIDQRLGQHAADGEARIERVERVLEHELRRAAERLELRALHRREVEAVDRDAARGRRLELEQQPPGRGLAAAGLAEQPDAFVLVEREVDPVDRVHGGSAACEHIAERAPHREVLGEALYVDEGCHVAASLARVAQARGFGAAPAGGAMIAGDFGERRVVAAAARDHERAARREAAAGRRRAQVGRRARDRHDLRGRAREIGKGVGQAHRVGMARPRQHLADRAGLDHLARIHHDDPVAHIGDDADVVRHQHDREAEALLQVAQRVEHLALHDHVERRHRLVGDQQLRIERQRQRDADALAHAAGELVRVVVLAAGIEADHAKQLVDARADVGGLVAAALGQHLADLRRDAIDRIERVHRALRDEGDLAPEHVALLRLA